MGKGAKRGRTGSPSRPARYRRGGGPVARPEVEGSGTGTVAIAVTEADTSPPSPVEPSFTSPPSPVEPSYSWPPPSPVEASFPPPPRLNPMPFAPPPPMGSGFDDLEELSFPRTGYPLSTRSLVMALVIALAFGGGILTQKRHDTGLIRPAAAAAAAIASARNGGAAAEGGALTGTISAVGSAKLTVRDDKGTEHKVTLPEAAVLLKKVTADALTIGAKVAVQGNPDPDGTLHATAVLAS